MRHRYELSGVRIESDFRLASLPFEAAEGAAPVLRLRLTEEASGEPAGDWMMTRTIDGVPWLSVKRTRGGYLLRIPSYADFTLDTQRAELTCAPARSCSLEILEQLFIDQIFPLVLHVTGRFSFHASSVALAGGGVIAFLGSAGLGKSTLASSLARTPFATLFSDDCLALTTTAAGVLGHPSYPSSRLWPPSADALFRDRGELPAASPRTSKRRIALPAVRAEEPLSRVYLLEQSDGAPSIQRLRRRDAIAALAAYLHRLDFEDKTRLAEEIDVLSRVATHAVVARLGYRRSYAELPAVHAVILADASQAIGETSGQRD
jgi:hypothetical protein